MHEIREHGGMGTQCTVEPGGGTNHNQKGNGAPVYGCTLLLLLCFF